MYTTKHHSIRKLVLSSHLLCFLILHPFLYLIPLSSSLTQAIRNFSISKSLFKHFMLPFISMFFIIHRERLGERWGAAHLEKAREQSLHLQEPAASACTTLYHSKPWIRYDIVSTLTRSVLAPVFISRSVLEDERPDEMFIAFTKCSWSIGWLQSIYLCVPNSSVNTSHTPHL